MGNIVHISVVAATLAKQKSSNNMDDFKKYRWILWLLIGLIFVPVVFYILNFGSLHLSDNKSDWGTLGDYIGGILNPLISLVTLGVTGYIAYSFNEYEKRRDIQSQEEADMKSYLELYQYFVGPEFREKRQIAWNVIRRAIENPEYADFIIKENYICRFSDRIRRSDVYDKFKDIYKTESFANKQDFLHKESEDRHKLDSVINFFQLLAIKNVPKDNYKVCDFYYDSWRPLLYWYAEKIEEGYDKYPINFKYNNPPNLRAAIVLLDEKYYHPKEIDGLTINIIDDHPLLKWYVSK